jgi:hypothetical protein
VLSSIAPHLAGAVWIEVGDTAAADAGMVRMQSDIFAVVPAALAFLVI